MYSLILNYMIGMFCPKGYGFLTNFGLNMAHGYRFCPLWPESGYNFHGIMRSYKLFRSTHIYYIDTSVLLENKPLVNFIKTTSGT